MSYNSIRAISKNDGQNNITFSWYSLFLDVPVNSQMVQTLTAPDSDWSPLWGGHTSFPDFQSCSHSEASRDMMKTAMLLCHLCALHCAYVLTLLLEIMKVCREVRGKDTATVEKNSNIVFPERASKRLLMLCGVWVFKCVVLQQLWNAISMCRHWGSACVSVCSWLSVSVSSLKPPQDAVCMLRIRPVCVHLCLWWSGAHYSTCSAGKLGISSKRFQAWSAMKAQLRDKSAAAAATIAHR